jgi:hypothetical protein
MHLQLLLFLHRSADKLPCHVPYMPAAAFTAAFTASLLGWDEQRLVLD